MSKLREALPRLLISAILCLALSALGLLGALSATLLNPNHIHTALSRSGYYEQLADSLLYELRDIYARHGLAPPLLGARINAEFTSTAIRSALRALLDDAPVPADPALFGEITQAVMSDAAHYGLSVDPALVKSAEAAQWQALEACHRAARPPLATLLGRLRAALNPSGVLLLACLCGGICLLAIWALRVYSPCCEAFARILLRSGLAAGLCLALCAGGLCQLARPLLPGLSGCVADYARLLFSGVTQAMLLAGLITAALSLLCVPPVRRGGEALMRKTRSLRTSLTSIVTKVAHDAWAGKL